MKVILTGSTGYVGNAVLLRCLEEVEITEVVAFSRKELSISHAKLKVIIHEDYSTYPPSVLTQLDGAVACIYCLGTNVPVSPPELNRQINFGYATSTATQFAKYFANSKPFRFVYLSGALVEKDPTKHLWLVPGNRKMRGELEIALLKLHDEQKEKGFEVIITRPGFVQPKGAIARTWVLNTVANAITINQLAQAMVYLAINGSKEVFVENPQLMKLAK